MPVPGRVHERPEQRADILRFARMWLELAEPVDELRGAYELPRRR